jgi:hypothetical protein
LSPEKFVKKASAVTLFPLVDKFADLQGTLLESDMHAANCHFSNGLSANFRNLLTNRRAEID